jgi:signal transduction histidine kinase
MKHKVWHKYAIVYLVAAALILIATNLIARPFYQSDNMKRHKARIYKECVVISDEYISEYKLPGFTLETFLLQMKAVRMMLDADIWVVGADGRMIAATGENLQTTPINLNEKAPGLLDNTYSENVFVEGLTKEKVLCAVEPVKEGYNIKGFIVIAEPMSRTTDETDNFIIRMNIISGTCLLILLLVFFQFAVYHTKNLQNINKTIIAYTDGDFTAEAGVRGHDEYRDVALSAHMLAEQHANLVDYQKNFVANISHDFRSPLTSIKGYAEAMKDGTIPYEIQGKYLNIILFETERISNLTNDLLDLSNFENKGVRLIWERFDIVKMLKQSSATFEGKCSQKNMKIRLVFPENELYAYADKGKIQQVVHNLIDNAIKFSKPDSVVTVVVAEKRDKVLVSVKDTGIGIPKDAIGKIWERFYKTDLSRGKDKRGTGLGLSITKQIIAAHNENIKVISTEGEGTEFVFSLQRADS